MAFTEKRLAGPTALTANTETNLYVCPTTQTTTTLIKQVLVTNTGSATTFDLSLVPQGGTAGTANRLFSALALSANETVLLDVSQVMSSGDFISARSGAGSTVNVTISGVENSGLMVISGLADSAVTTAKIADLNVATSKIDNLAVTTGKIANNAVTQEKLASSLSGMTVTTSSLLSTAIPSPFEGQMAFLTDTDLMLVWSGSAWVEVSSMLTKAPRGIMAISFRNTVFFPDTTEKDYLTISFTAVANRYYRYTIYAGNTDADASRTMTIKLTDASNAVLNQTLMTVTTDFRLTSHMTVRTETAGAITRKIRMVTNGGNASMNNSTNIGFLMVEDIGAA